MLSPGSSLDAALTDLGSDVTVEFKLDGARIQVHRDGDVRVWTRTLREITDGVPELVERVRASRAPRRCSTARPSPSTTTAGRGRSRTR